MNKGLGRKIGRASLALVLGCGARVAPAAESVYRQLQEIAIGGDGGWDYVAVDAAKHRLYVSHATKVVVVDLTRNTVVGEIAPTPGVHGIALAPDLDRGFVSNGQEGTAAIVDLNTLQILSRVKTGENPDAILYEPVHHEVYTFNGRGKSATVFDARTGEVRATIPLAGKPEFAVFDAAAGRIYVNIEDTSTLVAIDSAKRTVVASWPIAPGEEASGLALDSARHRLFVGCRNRLMLMMDATSGKVLASVPIGSGVDANAFDPGTGLAFASSSDGTLTVARADGGDALGVVQTLSTPLRSRTMTIDPTTHRLYVAAAEFTSVAAGPDGKPQRPQAVSGSFKVVVYEKAEKASP
jgi:DNA-binding beta-propeller fold protein YncE